MKALAKIYTIHAFALLVNPFLSKTYRETALNTLGEKVGTEKRSKLLTLFFKPLDV